MTDDRITHAGGTGRDRLPNNERRNAPKMIELLPHPEVLEHYEDILPGSAKQLMQMFEGEQKHRHAWELQAIRIHSVSTVLGQVLGFLIAIAIFTSAAIIGIYGNGAIGAFIWVFGVAIVVMAGLVWSYAKSMGQRPLFARPTMRTHFRPVKDKSDEPMSRKSED